MIQNKRQRICLYLLCLCIFLLFPGINSFAYTETTGVVIANSAKIRDKADTGGAVLGSVNANKTISICGEETGSDGMVWYQVYVNASTKGYIRSDLVKKAGGSQTSSTSSTTSSSSSSSSKTSVTAMDSKAGKVITDSVRIRSGASTTADVVATAKKGLDVTVTGQANGSDGKTWYQVKFNYNNEEITGFIRSDLVTFSGVESDASTTEITGTVSDGGEEGDENVENQELETETGELETEVTSEPETQETQASNTQEVVLVNTEKTPYVMPGFNQVVLNWKDQQITAWKNGDFYIFYAQVNGEEGWYMYDQPEDVYQRYVYETETATAPKGSSTGSTLAIAGLGILVAILIGIIIVMVLKIRDLKYDRWDDEDYPEEEDDYGDDEDEDEDEDEEDMTRGRVNVRSNATAPNRNPRGMQSQTPLRQKMDDMPERRRQEQAQRRPVSGTTDDAQMQRRPVRRPEGAPMSNRAEGQQRPVNPQQRPVNPQQRPMNPQQRPVNGQVRRPVEGQQPVRRPVANPEGRPVRPNAPQGAGRDDMRRPVSQGAPARRRVQPQNKEQDDMEFIDI